MPDPGPSVRESALAALAARCAGLQTPGQPRPLSVVRGMIAAPEELVPILSVVSSPESMIDSGYGRINLVTPVELRLFLSFDGPGVCPLAESMRAAMQALIFSAGESGEELNLGGAVDRLEYEGGGVEEYPEAGQRHVSVVLNVNLYYATLRDNPYTRP